MSTYIIGDLHGCLEPLQLLLDKINFDPASDKLWFVGDIVNRGPASLETLRFVKKLDECSEGDNTKVVLGNHDLHFLAVYHGVRKRSGKDTLQELTDAPDSKALVDWLRQQPLLHHDEQLNTVLVHAGIPPMWSLETAKKQANKLTKILRSDRYTDFLADIFGNEPTHWRDADTKKKRRRFAMNAFTRMRYCFSDGSIDFSFNGQPAAKPPDLSAWYNVLNRENIDEVIVFGHWAAHPAIAP